ncbi:hypothetical protein K3725_13605 [Leisingera sp. S132]|uniref:hypothetical protein n=1 Tax=Leisingera sp. S132 TaxID=2867016 RepID=UPI0021A336EF|nr:hypothetical protein [Leisingera sp. S132]UWQ78344.1 hypothetical protein K3725_13605 [Leisingera sp. S132]
MRIFLSGLFLLANSAAVLACPEGAETMVSCTFKDGVKKLTTCLQGEQATYVFGTPGRQPELEMKRDVRDVDMTPWPGIGGSIWEEVIFTNADARYIVYYSISKDPGAQNPMEGGVVVEQSGKELAHLRCDAGSVDSGYPLPLFDAKIAAGQEYSLETGAWQ